MKTSRRAPAKINLFLKVLGKREDGFHDIESVFTPLELHDLITLELFPGRGITVECPGYPDLSNEQNLVHKALSLLFEACGASDMGANVIVKKNTPVSAGLGGGSSDAAAAMQAAADLLGIETSKSLLSQVAAQVGSDVPFFLGSGPAWVRGRGEVVEPIMDLPELDLVLVKPGEGMSTAEAYRLFDQHNRGLTRPLHDAIKPAFFESVAQAAGLVGNDLEAVTGQAVAGVADAVERLLDKGALAAAMSGSGPTVFGLFGSAAEASEVASQLAETLGCWVISTKGLRQLDQVWLRLGESEHGSYTG